MNGVLSLRAPEMLTVTSLQSDLHVIPLKWWQILDKLDMLTDSVHMYTFELLTDNKTRTNVCTKNVDILWNKCVHLKCWQILAAWDFMHRSRKISLGGSEGYKKFSKGVQGKFLVILLCKSNLTPPPSSKLMCRLETCECWQIKCRSYVNSLSVEKNTRFYMHSMGAYKVRNETKTNETKRNETNRN